MRMKRPIAVFSMFAIVASSAFGVLCPVRDRADVNRDGCHDVLDVQAIVAEVLAGGAAAEQADVNGDGCLDILDFQRAVAAVNLPAGAKEAPRNQELPKAFHSSAPRARTVSAEPVRVLGIRALLAPEPPYPKSSRRDAAEPIPPPTQRFLFHLTPHAPPVQI